MVAYPLPVPTAGVGAQSPALVAMDGRSMLLSCHTGWVRTPAEQPSWGPVAQLTYRWGCTECIFTAVSEFSQGGTTGRAESGAWHFPYYSSAFCCLIADL